MEDSNIQETHKRFAVDLFNLTWDLIEKEDRSQAEIDRMINAVHGSRYHWEIAGDAVHIARGEWLISQVYAILQRPEPCHYHASRCLQITLENELKDFDLAFAYEAMTRAKDLTSSPIKKAKFLTLAKDSGAKIQDKEDRKYFFSELQTIQQSPD